MELNTEQQPRKRRVMDTSNGDARRAVAAIVAKFGTWRGDVASFTVRSAQLRNQADANFMLERCLTIASEVAAARMELLLSLEGAPRRVVGHSRIVDVERALDSIEAGLAIIRQQLRGDA